MAEAEESQAGRRNCPHLGCVGDPSSHLAEASDSHMCYAGRTPLQLDPERQVHYCLSDRFVLCPRWALGAPEEPPETASPEGEDGPKPESNPPEIPSRRAARVPNLVLLAPVVVVLSLVALGGPWGPFPILTDSATSPAAVPTATTQPSDGQTRLPAAVGTATPSTPATQVPAPSATVQRASSPTAIAGAAPGGGPVPSPAPTPLPVPSPAPLPTPRTYLVPAGDTLSQISARFGVPIEEIMKANGIQDRNLILTGRTLVIP